MTRLAALALALPVLACVPEGNGPGAGDPGPVVARVGGEDVHQRDLDDWLRDDLFRQATAGKDAAALYEFRSQGLDRMIEEQLLDAEAERRGVDLATLQEQVVGEVVIGDDEVNEFYEANRERLVEQSFEDLAPRIRDYLEKSKRLASWSEFIDGLHEAAGVERLMDVPRIEVAAVGPSLGPDDAPVTIVEFSDFNCPFCQRVVPTLKTLLERYPDQVRVVFRHYPLDMHPRARAIAEASACADEQEGFWAFHDAVFDDPAPLEDAAIRELAGSLGLDLAAFDACLADGRAAALVERDVSDGSAAGVTGTPAFFVNGIRLSGAQPVEAFVRVIEGELPEQTAEADPASEG